MDYYCAKFVDFSFSRFGNIVKLFMDSWISDEELGKGNTT